MPTCPYCGAPLPEGAIACGNCGASLVSSQPQKSTPFQSQPQPASSGSSSTSWSSGSSDYAMEARLQKALKRNWLLSRLVIGLSVLALVLLIILII